MFGYSLPGMSRPPHVARCLSLLDDLETPVLQVWGWPGSGRGALLAALLERDGAAPLAPADLGETGRRRQAVAAAVGRGARWLVVQGLPAGADAPELLRALAELLPADRRLVFASGRRVPSPAPLHGLLPPRALALEPREVAEVLRRQGVEAGGEEALDALTVAADGWYRPLLLAARAAGEGDAPPERPEELAALPAVADFLHTAVLADLPAEDRDALARIVTGAGGVEEAAVRRLTEEWGLLLDDGEGPRPPRLLRAWLEREGTAGRRLSRARTAAPPLLDADGDGAEPPVRIPEGVLFRLHFLGRPEGWRRRPDGSWRRLHWPLQRAFKVLAYLASSPERRAAREEIVEALWAEESADSIRRNFHPTLSHLRRALRDGPAGPELDPLPLIDGVYALSPEVGWWIDLEELERLIAEGRAHADQCREAEAAVLWEAAWRLYRGELLAGSYEPWAARRREGYQRRYLALLQDLGAVYERLERPDEAVDAYRAVLVEDALQERVHLALMRLYGRRGRRDLVRRQYDRLTALLQEELGVEPLAETTREYHRLMTVRR